MSGNYDHLRRALANPPTVSPQAAADFRRRYPNGSPGLETLIRNAQDRLRPSRKHWFTPARPTLLRWLRSFLMRMI